jgi:hypothetical protein
MFERMNPDPWADLNRRAADLLHAIVLWNPGPVSHPWQLMRPHVSRLTRTLKAAGVLETHGKSVEPVWRSELLAAATAAARSCDKHSSSVGPQRPVKLAATRLCAVIARLSEKDAAPAGVMANAR